MTKELNIKSSTIEKGLEIATIFLQGLIVPSVNEVGLLIKDKVVLWRFNNQIKMLNRAKEICDDNNIKPKEISLKLLCPLLDYAGLEEDEDLRENWAFLLSNMVDSDQNIQNHVFPYLLSQISKSEFNELQKTYFLKTERIVRLNEELKIHLENKPLLEKSILEEISKVDIKDYSKKWKLESKLKELSDNERILKSRINESEQLSQTNLQEYEISNLSRLGVIKGIPIHYVYSEPIRVKGKNSQYYSHEIDEDQTIDLDISVEADGENFSCGLNVG